MPRIPYRYPTAGTDAGADAIREQRGPARGLTPLDGTLLNSSPIAAGWNNLLCAVRTKTSLPDDVREIMVSCVAAHSLCGSDLLSRSYQLVLTILVFLSVSRTFCI